MRLLWEDKWFLTFWMIVGYAIQMKGPYLFALALSGLVLLTNFSRNTCFLATLPIGVVLTLIYQ